MNGRNARVFVFALASIIFASINSASAQIVALGHSAVRGNVAESEMWPAVLEGLLRARGSQVHVANAGVLGRDHWGYTCAGFECCPGRDQDRYLGRQPGQ